MNEFKKGDRIVITAVGKKPLSGRYFWKGDIGVIIGIDQLSERRYYIDFDNQGNKKVYGDGQWSISSDVRRDDDRYAQFKLYEAPEVIDWTKYEGKEAWFSISGGTKEWVKGKLYKYAPELTPSFLAVLDKDQDTIRQFNYIKTSCEIDWSKISAGTKVIVSDTPDFGGPTTEEFLCYTPDRGYPFWVVAGGRCSETAHAYKYCKLA